MPVSILGVSVPYERWFDGLAQPVYSQLEGEDEATTADSHNTDVGSWLEIFQSFAVARQAAYDNYLGDAVILTDVVNAAYAETLDKTAGDDYIAQGLAAIEQLWTNRVIIAASVKAKLVSLSVPRPTIEAAGRDHVRAIVRAGEVRHEMVEFARKLLRL